VDDRPQFEIGENQVYRKAIVNQLPRLQRSFFSLEENEVPEVPKALVDFLERHIQATEADKESSSHQS
jgi:hypothetical protein